ncbi:MAG TPA: response regulator [Sphingobium sp.]|uniref:response regulator n=1 Tax=Sphingobium sp. TaxID=1912891 RepID=UPI002ED52A50
MASQAQPRVPKHAAPRILLVEDDDRQRSLLCGLIEEQGYAVEAVGSAALAVGAMRSAFDLLLTDVDLGSRLTGLDLVRFVRSVQPGLPVVVVSAREPAAATTEASGPLVFLRKPYTSEALLNAVLQLAPLD